MDGGELILIAEDDPDQSEMLRDALKANGFRVDTVATGDMALQYLTERSHHAAVMDDRMPGMAGSTVLKAYKEMGAKAATPVIMVSAFAPIEDLAQYKLDGAAASIAKPFKTAQIIDLLRRVISDSKLASK